MDPHVDTIRGGGGGGFIYIILGPYLNLGVINKTGQIVNNKIFLGRLGTIPNHEYESVFTFIIHHNSAASLIACWAGISGVAGSIPVDCDLDFVFGKIVYFWLPNGSDGT